MGAQSNNVKVFQTEKEIFDSILKNIKMYKDTVEKRQDFIKSQLGLNVAGLFKVGAGINKTILLYATKDLILDTKKNLEKITSALDFENLKTMSGVRQVQRLIERSTADIDEKYKRVLSNNEKPEKPEEAAAKEVWDYCKDCVVQFMRFAADLLKNAYNYFAYHNSISDKNEKLEQALNHNRDARFSTSLAKLFKNEQDSLREQTMKMRTYEERIVQVDGDVATARI